MVEAFYQQLFIYGHSRYPGPRCYADMDGRLSPKPSDNKVSLVVTLRHFLIRCHRIPNVYLQPLFHKLPNKYELEFRPDYRCYRVGTLFC